jgi:DNA polymerase delta subunit 3
VLNSFLTNVKALRFCGVSNSNVTRKTDGKHVSLVPPKPVDGTSAFQKDLHSLKPQKQEPAGPTTSSNVGASENKSEKEKVSKPSPIIKEPSKLKDQNGKSSSANSGSLANMWGRASTKPKPVKETAEDVPSIAGKDLKLNIILVFFC